MAMMLPQVAIAAAVTESDVNVMTPDGTASIGSGKNSPPWRDPGHAVVQDRDFIDRAPRGSRNGRGEWHSSM